MKKSLTMGLSFKKSLNMGNFFGKITPEHGYGSRAADGTSRRIQIWEPPRVLPILEVPWLGFSFTLANFAKI